MDIVDRIDLFLEEVVAGEPGTTTGDVAKFETPIKKKKKKKKKY